MDLQKTLIESGNTKTKGKWKTTSVSVALHGAVVAALIGLSMTTTEKVAAEEKAIPVYIQQAAAPPPPPPPPPAAHHASAPSTPVTPKVQPVQPVRPTFTAPVETPRELPIPTASVADTSASDNSSSTTPDEPGAVDGGVSGGVEGGQIGGTVGGQIGGEKGGVIGGQLGGTVGGDPAGTATPPAPPAPPAGPMRVGGDVKAPTVVQRVDPEYTEVARRARVTGIVIVEAIIDKQGNVDQVKIVRGLPMGLSESATTAVRRWKFKPGTLNGQPVAVIFNLTVMFQLGADSPTISSVKARKAPAEKAPVTAAPSAPEAQPAEPTVPAPPAETPAAPADPTSPPQP